MESDPWPRAVAVPSTCPTSTQLNTDGRRFGASTISPLHLYRPNIKSACNRLGTSGSTSAGIMPIEFAGQRSNRGDEAGFALGAFPKQAGDPADTPALPFQPRSADVLPQACPPGAGDRPLRSKTTGEADHGPFPARFRLLKSAVTPGRSGGLTRPPCRAHSRHVHGRADRKRHPRASRR